MSMISKKTNIFENVKKCYLIVHKGFTLSTIIAFSSFLCSHKQKHYLIELFFHPPDGGDVQVIEGAPKQRHPDSLK